MTDRMIQIVPQDGEIAACSVPGKRFSYRYAYARSSDFKTANESGQDYIIIHRSESRLSFALCDGVSQSFYGDLAAHYLGDFLSQWLWDIAETRPDEKEFGEQLGTVLAKQTSGAFEAVKNFRLPDNLAPMLINVLEKKRALGSESMFVSGVLDFSTDYLALSWMGDSRLWLFDLDGKPKIAFGDLFDTHERWSSSKGPVGAPHAFTSLVHDFKRIAAYSDGLASIDKAIPLGSPDNSTLNLLIHEAGESPTSDDISFLEIWLGASPNFNQGPLPRPEGLKAVLNGGKQLISWQAAGKEASYEIEFHLADGQIEKMRTPAPEISLPYQGLVKPVAWLRVRTWQKQRMSEWSLRLDIHPPGGEPASTTAAALPIMPATSQNVTSPVVKPGQTPSRATTQANASAAPPPDAPKKRGNRSYWFLGGAIVVVVLALAAASFAILPRILATPTPNPTVDLTSMQPKPTDTQLPAPSLTGTNTQSPSPSSTKTTTPSPSPSSTSTNTPSPAPSHTSTIAPTSEGTPAAYAITQEITLTPDLTYRSVEPAGTDRLVVFSSQGILELDLATFKAGDLLPAVSLSQAAINKTGTLLAVESDNIQIYKLPGFEPVTTVQGTTCGFAFEPNSDTLTVVHPDGTTTSCSTSGICVPLSSFAPFTQRCQVEYSSTGNLLAIGTDQSIQVLDVKNLRLDLESPGSWFSFRPDEELVFQHPTGIEIWSSSSSFQNWPFSSGLSVKALSPDGTFLAALSAATQKLEIWGVGSSQPMGKISIPQGEELIDAFFLPDNHSVITLTSKGRVTEWKIKD